MVAKNKANIFLYTIYFGKVGPSLFPIKSMSPASITLIATFPITLLHNSSTISAEILI